MMLGHECAKTLSQLIGFDNRLTAEVILSKNAKYLLVLALQM